jgi:signal transduction histidine kinase
MGLSRRTLTVYTLLAAVWTLVVVWQAEEHYRFRAAAKADLSTRSRVIANTVSACIRGMRFRGTVLKERLEPVLNELVNGRTNELVGSSELTSIVLLNAAGDVIASAGREIDLTQKDILQQGEHWGQRNVTFVNLVDIGAGPAWEGGTNPTVVLPRMDDLTNRFPEGLRNRQVPRREPGGEPPPPPADGPPQHELDGVGTSASNSSSNASPRSESDQRSREGAPRTRRPPWLRGLSDAEYQSLVGNLALHDLVLAMSIDSFRAASRRDLWLRIVIVFLATISAFGSGLTWGNLVTSSDLQIRLVKASELNTHLKEMNLAAAGLAHETRNPLNIIRGLAQIISRQPDIAQEIQQKTREIIIEADKVASQLNEFINYSRPREVRRSFIGLGSLINDVVRTLSYDIEEKGIRLETIGEPLTIEADEQMLRQALFNLLLNAIQAVDKKGEIQVVVQRQSAPEAVLEVRDNGPGVPPERRAEIFKPYFTMQKTGTGLGLAVVQQIVLAHGWEIECASNLPKGAVFRISHLKLRT